MNDKIICATKLKHYASYSTVFEKNERTVYGKNDNLEQGALNGIEQVSLSLQNKTHGS